MRVLSQYVIPFLCFLHPSTNKIDKKPKSLIDNIFLNSVEFETFFGNLASLMSDNLPQLLILKDFHCKDTVTNHFLYERN